MKMMKYVILALLAVAIGAGAYWASTIMVSLPKESSSTLISSLQKTKDIDKLYTGVYLIPVIDLERGILKRDAIKEGVKTYLNPLKLAEKAQRLFEDKPLVKESEAKQVVKGCCYKKYEVAVGYDNLMQILSNDEYVLAACNSNLDRLPPPQILAVNCRSTESKGKYDSSGSCYGWDSDDATRKKVITKVMNEEGIEGKITSRGKESLKNFLSAFCS